VRALLTRALLFWVLLLPAARPAHASELLILQSNHSPACAEVQRGLHARYRGSERTVVLSDYVEVDVARLVKEERPRLVLTLGDRALTEAKHLQEVPVVALLALSLQGRRRGGQLGGITMLPPPEQYLNLFAALGTADVGVLYDPAHTGGYLKRVAHEARAYGVNLVAEPVSDPREIQGKLARLKGKVQALWLLPDPTVVTSVNSEALLLFAMNQNLPLVAFSSHYLDKGAAIALDLDYYDLGQQAAELVVSLLKSGSSHKVPVLDPRKSLPRANERVLRKLRLPSARDDR